MIRWNLKSNTKKERDQSCNYASGKGKVNVKALRGKPAQYFTKIAIKPF